MRHKPDVPLGSPRAASPQQEQREQDKSRQDKVRKAVKSPIQVGTILQKALTAIGVTEERVSSIFGSCGCKRRVRKLNELSDWAYTLVRRKNEGKEPGEKDKEELARILGEIK